MYTGNKLKSLLSLKFGTTLTHTNSESPTKVSYVAETTFGTQRTVGRFRRRIFIIHHLLRRYRLLNQRKQNRLIYYLTLTYTVIVWSAANLLIGLPSLPGTQKLTLFCVISATLLTTLVTKLLESVKELI